MWSLLAPPGLGGLRLGSLAQQGAQVSLWGLGLDVGLRV